MLFMMSFVCELILIISVTCHKQDVVLPCSADFSPFASSMLPLHWSVLRGDVFCNIHSETQTSVYGQTFIAPLQLLLTLPPVLMPAGLGNYDPSPDLTWSGLLSFLLFISHPPCPKSRMKASGCLVVCSLIECACGRKEAVLQQAPDALLMGSRGTFHLEMLKDLKVADISYQGYLFLPAQLQSCCLLQYVVPNSDLHVRKTDVQLIHANWGIEPTRPHRYRRVQKLCSAGNTFFPN